MLHQQKDVMIYADRRTSLYDLHRVISTILYSKNNYSETFKRETPLGAKNPAPFGAATNSWSRCQDINFSEFPVKNYAAP